jgi:hypothetical protein
MIVVPTVERNYQIGEFRDRGGLRLLSQPRTRCCDSALSVASAAPALGAASEMAAEVQGME